MVEPPAPPPPPDGPPPATPPPEAPAPVRISAKGPDLILLIAGAIFLVASFLPWYRVTFGRRTIVSVSYSSSAWGSGGLGVLAALFGIAALVVVFSVSAGAKRSTSQSAVLLALVLSTGALVFTLLRLALRPQGSVEVETLGRGLVHITRGFGLWLAFAAAIVMSVAAYQKYRESAV